MSAAKSAAIRIRLLRDYMLAGDIHHPPATAPIAKKGEVHTALLRDDGVTTQFVIGEMAFAADLGKDAEVVGA